MDVPNFVFCLFSIFLVENGAQSFRTEQAFATPFSSKFHLGRKCVSVTTKRKHTWKLLNAGGRPNWRIGSPERPRCCGSNHADAILRVTSTRYSSVRDETSPLPPLPPPPIATELPKLSELIRRHEEAAKAPPANVTSGRRRQNESDDGFETTSSATTRGRQSLSPIIKNNLHSARSTGREQHERPKKPKQRGKKKQGQGKPWAATYLVSRRTQQRLQRAAATVTVAQRNHGNTAFEHGIYDDDHLCRANIVLETLLKTPPEECNEVNVVAAVTISVKQMQKYVDAVARHRRRPSQQEAKKHGTKEVHRLVANVTAICSILQLLLSERRLRFRQLANVAWSLVKGLQILRQLEKHEVGGGGTMPKTTDLKTERLSRSLDILMGEISHQITTCLSGSVQARAGTSKTEDTAAAKQRPTPPAVVELCMICHAFAVYIPRPCPTGWTWPPKEARTPLGVSASPPIHNDAADVITFIEDMDGFEASATMVSTSKKEEVWAFDSSEESPRVSLQINGHLDFPWVDNCTERLQLCHTVEMMFEALASYFIGEGGVDNQHEHATRNDEDCDESMVRPGTSLDGSYYSHHQHGSIDESAPTSSSAVLKECSWGELANIAWSYAHGGHNTPVCEALLKAVVVEAALRIDSLTTETSIGDVGAAAASKRQTISGGQKSNQVRSPDVPFFSSESSSLPSSSPSMPLARDISLIAWSLGVQQVNNFGLGEDLEVFVDKIAKAELTCRITRHSVSRARCLSGWKAQDLVQLASCLAYAGIDHRELLHAIFERARENIESFQSWEIAIMLWVQARLYLTSSQLGDDAYSLFTGAAVNCIARRLGLADENNGARILDSGVCRPESSDQLLESIGIGPREQANLAWSLTVLEEYTPDSIQLLQAIFRTSSSSHTVMKLEHAHQLWQALFLLRNDCPDAVQHATEEFAQWLEDRWKEEKARKKVSSARHRALSETLRLMRVDHYNEHDEDIDVAIVLKANSDWTHTATTSGQNEVVQTYGRTTTAPATGKSLVGDDHFRVAVEFDGPAHFTRGGRRALGHTVLKYRLLKLQGWTVVRVPYYEFDKIPFWANMVRCLFWRYPDGDITLLVRCRLGSVVTSQQKQQSHTLMYAPSPPPPPHTQERQRYLQRLLKTHANIRFSDIDVSEYKAIVPNRRSRFD